MKDEAAQANANSSETTASPANNEQQLVERARVAVSQCNWVVGECAAEWTQRYAKGRTDADFARMVGLSADQVYQRRRVWETFHDVRDHYPHLKWSHFYVALNWDDAAESLAWAEENKATVAEMRAWRRLQHGEDLTQPDPQAVFSAGLDDPTVIEGGVIAAVRDVDDAEGDRSVPFDGGEVRTPPGGVNRAETAAAAARELPAGASPEDYTPFRSDALKPPEKADKADDVGAPAAHADVESRLRKLVSRLQRVDNELTSDFLDHIARLPEETRRPLIEVVESLHGKLAAVHV